MTYQQALERLGKRDSKKLRYATYLTRVEDGIAIKQHQTNIITLYPDGKIKLDSGGWRTKTTKDRLNSYQPHRIYQRNSVWYFSNGAVFEDGIIINGNLPEPDKAKEKAQKDLQKQIQKYVKGYVDAFMAGEVPAPSGGDCWGCYLVTKDGRTMGELGNNDHLLMHFEEKYYVPSLLHKAVERYPVAPLVMSYIGGMWGFCEKFNFGSMDSIAKHQITSSLRRFLKHSLKLA